MNTNQVKGYFQIVLSGLFLIAVALLIILQWGNAVLFTAFGPPVTANLALFMLGNAAGGVVLWHMIKMLYHGVMNLRKGNRQKAFDEVAHSVHQKKKPPPAEAPKPASISDAKADGPSEPNPS